MLSRSSNPPQTSNGFSLAPRVSPLVGRAAEIEALSSALRECEAGNGRTLFVVGEAGVGKTRLATAVAEQATRRGFAVAVGRAYPVETGVPYAVFSDAMLPLLRSMEPSSLTLLTRGGTAELAKLFPALDLPGGAPAIGRGDPTELKGRLLWNFSQFLSRFAKQRQPLLIILENLQWADSASLEMFHFVARQIGNDRIVLIGTHNDPDHLENGALRATELSLRGFATAERLRLGPLDVSAIAELLQLTFDADAEKILPFAERLHRWTAGNAFFISETFHALVDAKQLHHGPSGWVGWDVQELRVPTTIREAVLARIAERSPNARRLADIVAALGTQATHEELRAVGGLDEDALIAAVDELRRADLLAERADGDEIVYDFSHPILQEALYEKIGLARRRTLHGIIAEALENLYDGRAMLHAGQLAYHYARGETRRLAAKAVVISRLPRARRRHDMPIERRPTTWNERCRSQSRSPRRKSRRLSLSWLVCGNDLVIIQLRCSCGSAPLPTRRRSTTTGELRPFSARWDSLSTGAASSMRRSHIMSLLKSPHGVRATHTSKHGY